MPVLEVASCRVSYEERGEGQFVLLLGRLALEPAPWAGQVEALGPTHRVIVLQHLAGPSSTELFADAVAGLLHELGAAPAHVVGADLGGAVAQQLALHHPELVRSLALHGTWGRADTHLTAILQSWQVSARVLSPVELARQVWPFIYTVWWFNDTPERQVELERVLAEGPPNVDDFCAQIDAALTHDVLDRLDEIRVPTLITVGDRDILTPAHHAYAIKDRMPGARVRVWQKMGHAPYWEIPEEFNRVTLDWINEH